MAQEESNDLDTLVNLLKSSSRTVAFSTCFHFGYIVLLAKISGFTIEELITIISKADKKLKEEEELFGFSRQSSFCMEDILDWMKNNGQEEETKDGR